MMKLYSLDQAAQKLVLDARKRNAQSLNQGYKMRLTVAYGLERFWGESLRLVREPENASYWKEAWDALVKILAEAGLTLPNDSPDPKDVDAVEAMAQQLWAIPIEDQRIAISVLTQLCDSIVWWTQRYKVGKNNSD